MRVLFLAYRDIKNPSSIGGDIYLWELARGLSRIGHKVTFVSSRYSHSSREETVDGVHILRIRGSLTLPFMLFKEYRKQLKGQFDAVIEEAIGGQRSPFLATLYVKEPVVAVWHQKHDKIFREQYPTAFAVVLSLFEVLLAKLYRKDTIVTPSKSSKEQILRLGFRRNKVNTVYDGVGSEFLKAKVGNKKGNTIVCLGKLRRYKRFDHALLAFKSILNGPDNDYKLIIAGKVSEIDRSYLEWLVNFARRLNIQNNVEFKVNISDDEKLKLLEESRLLVQPSPVEGFSIVVAEANRCGTPVVVSDGVPSDVVVDKLNGLVYP